jgi:hypothetical protein
MPNIQNKINCYKWREQNKEAYLAYQTEYYKNYLINNREKEIIRYRKRRLFLKECKRQREILFCI